MTRREIARKLLVIALAAFAMGLRAQSAGQNPLGVAWNVRGAWRAEGNPISIRSGDAIQPGSLLLPDPSASDHSITILLPDGQRILCECFTAQDCARGFRVPPLAVRPDGFANEMLGRIRAALAKGDIDSGSHDAPRLPQDEAVAVLGPENSIQVAGLASRLQNGRYTYEIRDVSAARLREPSHSLDKSSSMANFVVPGPGLYDIRITDSLDRPRIDLLAAAIRPSEKASVMEPFQEAHARFLDWKEDGQGWPIHDFQRAFLESLMLGIKPAMERQAASHTAPHPGVTAQPEFEPRPGIVKGDLSVALRSGTPGAAIHYTVDGSQPFLSSPVCRAPIVMKRIPLTIKAFATSPDHKDSPVVTGIFRIER